MRQSALARFCSPARMASGIASPTVAQVPYENQMAHKFGVVQRKLYGRWPVRQLTPRPRTAGHGEHDRSQVGSGVPGLARHPECRLERPVPRQSKRMTRRPFTEILVETAGTPASGDRVRTTLSSRAARGLSWRPIALDAVGDVNAVFGGAVAHFALSHPATAPRTPAPAPRTPSPRTPRGPRRGIPSRCTTRAPYPPPVSPHPPPSPRSARPGSPSRRTDRRPLRSARRR